MEIIESIKGPVYFDTNVFIYSLDGYEEYYGLLKTIFSHIAENHLLVVTSELTLAECLVKPVKDENKEATKQFEQYIQTSEIMKVKPVSRGILRQSANVRAEQGLKLPDAIHMATAIDQCCKTFITNDKKLKSRTPEGMQQIYLKALLDLDEENN